MPRPPTSIARAAAAAAARQPAGAERVDVVLVISVELKPGDRAQSPEAVAEAVAGLLAGEEVTVQDGWGDPSTYRITAIQPAVGEDELLDAIDTARRC